ncbi:ABC transporter family substrate-binding protein [Naasia lichenicola]|nr:ABC transporter family substrate-binding protein [Naasia lichenicola]
MHSMQKIRRRTAPALIAGVVGIALALTGCTSGGEATPEVTKQPLDPAGDVNPMDAADVPQGGELRFPLDSLPTNWNYGQVDGALDDASIIEQAIMLKTFNIGLDGAPALNTDLLDSAEAVSEDPLVIEYKINPDAVWSDGVPITAADFKAQWTAQNGTNEEYLIGDPTGYNSIGSVEQGTDPKDVVVTYATPFSDWKSLFSPLYPASQISTPEAFNTGYADAIPVTAGPFKLEKLDTSARTVSIVPDENWWGDAPKLDRVIFIALDGDADIDAYLNNEIDLVSAGSSDRYERIATADDTDIRAAPSASYSHIDFSSSGILADEKIRQALQHAINRQSIADVLVGTLPFETSLLGNHIFLGTDSGYVDNSSPAADFDPDAAKKILEDDGWTGDGAVRSKDGADLEVSMTIPAGIPTSNQIAQVVQAQLADVGVKLSIDEVDVDSFFSDYITPGAFDMTVFSWVGTGYYAAGASIFSTDPQSQNYGRIGTSDIDDLLGQVVQIPDADEANAMWNDIDEQVWEEGHSLPIIQSPRVIAIDPKIVNYGARPGAADIDWKIVGFSK